MTLTLAATGTTAITTYAYDEAGNKISQTDALGRTTKWGYDNARRVISRTLPNGETESFTYDAVGNQTSHTDFKGLKTSYTYDVNGRVVFATDSTGQTIGYLYTPSGQVASMSDARGVTKYTYDAKDRLARQDNPDGTFLAYTYDANGNITQRSTPAGTVAYAYDSLNRLVSVTDTAGKVTGYAYDANGNRTRTVLPNGTEADYSYDSLNRLTKVEHRTTATQAVIRGYAYTLNANGQRAQVQEYDAAGTIRTRAYSYDSLNRLTGDVLTDSRTPANSSTTAYTYGNTGNRASRTVTQGGTTTTTAYTYDADDRLSTEATAAGTTSYTWDANGNLVQKTEPTQTTLYAWDSNNRLQSVARGTSAATATTVATYQYDANGNRVGKTLADGTKITYLVDSNYAYAQVAQENATSPTGTATETDYLYGLERIEQTRAGQGTYYHDDGLGSTRLLTDASGNVTDSYEYDDYGALQSRTGTTRNDFMYAGEAYDQEAALSYNRARYLDVSAGRFTAVDPYAGNLSQPITLNKYAYANADPVNLIDPSGRVGMLELSADTLIEDVLADYAVTTMKDMVMDEVGDEILKSINVQRLLGARKLMLGNPGAADLVEALALLCRAGKGRCLLRKLPTFSTGLDMRFTSKHIHDSEHGDGNTIGGTMNALPFVLARTGVRIPVLYNKEPQCNRAARAFAFLAYKSPVSCDEYPFASTFMGGEALYLQGGVSLRMVPKGEQDRQGSLLGTRYGFYSRNKVGDVPSPKAFFLNIAIPWLPTFTISRTGNFTFK